MSYQIKLYHQVFDYQLSASALMVYAGILNYANRLGYAYVKHETLAKLTGLSAKTVQRATTQLEASGLITITQRHGVGGRLSYNGYTVTTLSGGFTLISNDIFRCGISKSAFCVYLYLRKCAGNSTKAFPSLTNMAENLGITIKTILVSVAELVSRKLLGKNHCKRQDGSYGHNQYHLKSILKAIESMFVPSPLTVSIETSMARKKTRLSERVWGFVSATTQKVYQLAINILHIFGKCKPFNGINL